MNCERHGDALVCPSCIRENPNRNPDLDEDALDGYQGELFVRRMRDALRVGSVEVKRDSVFQRTGNLYIEYAHDPGRRGEYKPSGIARTKAQLWVHVLHLGATEAALVFPVNLLKELCRPLIEAGKVGAEDSGSCPTRGVLLPMCYAAQALSGHLYEGAV
jgi:hypothetical protein